MRDVAEEVRHDRVPELQGVVEAVDVAEKGGGVEVGLGLAGPQGLGPLEGGEGGRDRSVGAAGVAGVVAAVSSPGRGGGRCLVGGQIRGTPNGQVL